MNEPDTTPFRPSDILTDTPRTAVMRDVPFPQYQAIRAINCSTVLAFDVHHGGCPLRGRFELMVGKESAPVPEAEEGEEEEDDPGVKSEALRFGSLYHTYILEPKQFAEQVRILDYEMGLRLIQAAKDAGSKTRATSHRDSGFKQLSTYREWKAEIERGGGHVIDERTLGKLEAMRSAMLHDRDIAEVLEKVGDTELTVLFGWPVGGGEYLQCKARIDALTDIDIIDLKSARETSPERFAFAVRRMGYDFQAAFYHRAAMAAGLIEDGALFGFLAQEKTPPYVPALHWMPEDWIDYARKELDATLHQIADACRNDRWPGIGANLLLPPPSVQEAIEMAG